jgi:hypothetical protein
MKITLTLLVMILLVPFAQAAKVDSLGLLKRDLGNTIEIISAREIRYCPDNTCEIYRVKNAKSVTKLPSFVYLHLFHQSDYIYLKEAVESSRSFREIANGDEPSIRKQVEKFCRRIEKTPSCVIAGMKKSLGVVVTKGRYDEGKFVES